MKKLAKGVELLDEIEGDGVPAARGSTVRYAARFFLARGDEVTRDAELIAAGTGRLDRKIIDGVELVVHRLDLGKRRAIAGIEKALVGMKKGGCREVLVAPHLAYGATGVPGRIPANALLRIKLWVERVEPAAGSASTRARGSR